MKTIFKQKFLRYCYLCLAIVFVLSLSPLFLNAKQIPSSTLDKSPLPELDYGDYLTLLKSNVDEVQKHSLAKIKTSFSLIQFLEDNNLDASAIPETLPEKIIEALEELCDSRYYAISFYYYDITTGFTISYDADRSFRGASSVKLPYAAYVLDLIDNNKASLSDEITLRTSDLRNGTSPIRDEKIPAGTNFTTRELLELLMVESDNTAYAMLSRTYPIYGFVSWANSNYGTKFYAARDKNGVSVNSMTSKSTGIILNLIYERAALGGENYIWLLEIMKKANKNTFVKYGLADNANGIWYAKDRVELEVSHKYGMDVYASNDAALVHFEDRPYVLVILTDWIGYTSDNPWWTEGDMRTVSFYIYQLHKYLVGLTAD